MAPERTERTTKPAAPPGAVTKPPAKAKASNRSMHAPSAEPGVPPPSSGSSTVRSSQPDAAAPVPEVEMSMYDPPPHASGGPGARTADSSRAQAGGAAGADADADARMATDADARVAEDADARMAADDDSTEFVIVGKLAWSAPGSANPAIDAVAFADLPDPDKQREFVAPCTLVFQFLGPFSPAKDENACAASILVQMHRVLRWPKEAAPVISVPRARGRLRLVEVFIAQLELFNRALQHYSVPANALRFRGANLALYGSGAALPSRALCVKVVGLPSNFASAQAAQALSLALHGYADVAKIYSLYRCVPAVDYEEEACALLALVILRPMRMATNPDAFPSERLKDLPGFVSYGGSDYELRYVGRPNFCQRCKSAATSFHVFDDCPKRLCYRCKQPGHLSNACPNLDA